MAVLPPRRFPPSETGADLTTHRAESQNEFFNPREFVHDRDVLLKCDRQQLATRRIGW